MKKIDGHVHACGMIVNTEGAMQYIKKYDLDKIVLTAGEPDSTKDYKMPYMSKMFKSSRLVYFMNFFISLLTGIKKMSKYIDQGNEKVALMAEKSPDYILNTYWINPLEEDAICKMEKFYQRHSFCMIKMHQCWTAFDIDDKKIIGIIEWAQKNKIPVFLHLKSKNQIIKFKKILKEYQTVIFILGHLIGIEEFDRTVGENVYFDISCAPLHSTEMLKKAYDNFGAKRIILGSDAPYGVDNINLAIGQMHDIGMSEIEVEFVCYKNIQEILKICN